MSLFVKFEGLSEARRELQQLPASLEKATILRLAQVAYDSAYGGSTRHNATGAMTQSLFNRAIPNGREVGHDPQRAPHAVFVQLGTRPHVIFPNKKKALRWAGGGKFFFSKKVNHPGYVGDPYLVRAADDAVRQFSTIVEAALKENK